MADVAETTGADDDDAADDIDVAASAEAGRADAPGPPKPAFAARLAGQVTRGLRTTAARGAARAWPVLRPRLSRLVISGGAGVLLYASFAPLNQWWAAILSLSLLSWVLIRPATTAVGGLGYGLLFGLAFYLPLLPWIGNLVGPMPWLVLALICAMCPALFGLYAVTVRGLPGWPAWFALGWSALEWVKSVVPFGGFPWGAVAFGQTHGPLLPLVQLGGTPLLSVGVVLIGCSATAIARETVNAWHLGNPAHPLPAGAVSAPTDAGPDHRDKHQHHLHLPRLHRGRPGHPPPAVMIPAIAICVVLVAAILVWPQVRRSGIGAEDEPTVTVAVVQGNVPRLGLDFNAQRRVVLDNHVRETLRLARDVRAGAAAQPDFVIWPEDSSDIDPLTNPDAAAEITQAASAIGAPILIGTVLQVPGRPADQPEFTNTMIVWNPGTGPAERHDKQIVQPFGEYLPMPWLFRHLSGYADRAGRFVPRPGTGIVHIAGVPLGVATCWEVIFDREPRAAVRNGAQLLAVPSNNATFNKTMSEQQLAFATIRAVEHDRYVVVAGTTGISAVIGPDGSVRARTGFFVADHFDAEVRLKTDITPATQWAPALQWLVIGAAVAAFGVGMRQNVALRRRNRRSDRPVSAPAGRTGDSDASAKLEATEDRDAGDAHEPGDGNSLSSRPPTKDQTEELHDHR